MAFAWSGTQDLTTSNEPGTDYELGARYLANADITITHIRVYQPDYGSAGVSVTGRKARVWSSVGVELEVVALPALLAVGWSEHALAAPREVAAGTTFWVSYTAERWYGFTAGGFPRTSADGNVICNSGAFHLARDTFPTTSGSNFYGIEFVYEAGFADEEAPVITASVTATDRTATLTFSAESDLPVAWRVDWGDGAVTADAATGVSHTYAADGVYAILLSATDTAELVGYDALAVAVELPPAAGDLHPNAELVAVAFLGGLTGVPAGKVATTLPQSAAGWEADGFVQVTSVGGDPERHVALRRPVVQVDCWANAGQSGKPPWGKAAHLAEIVMAALSDRDTFPATLTSLPAAYAHARVLSAYALTEPRRVSNDPGSYARYTFDMTLNWIEIP